MGEGRGIYSVAMFHVGASDISLAPIFYKSQSTLILLLLLSKSQPLALGFDLGLCAILDKTSTRSKKKGIL